MMQDVVNLLSYIGMHCDAGCGKSTHMQGCIGLQDVVNLRLLSNTWECSGGTQLINVLNTSSLHYTELYPVKLSDECLLSQ